MAFIGTTINLYKFGQGLMVGNYNQALKAGVDIGMGYVTALGPVGLVIGGTYFLLDYATQNVVPVESGAKMSFFSPDKTSVKP